MRETILEKWLKDYGWRYKSMNQGTVHTGWRGSMGHFSLFLKVLDSEILFCIPLFSSSILNLNFNQILRINHNLSKASLALNHQDVLVLQAILEGEITFLDFTARLGILAQYADEIYGWVLAMERKHQQTKFLS